MQPNFVTFHLFKIGLKHIRNNLQGKKKSYSYLIDEAIELLNTQFIFYLYTFIFVEL